MSFVNVLPREKQIEVIAALCDGLGVRAVSRITRVNRGTVAALALKVGNGCAELHDRMMVGIRTSRLELDELWAYVGKKQAQVDRKALGAAAVGDQYTFIALSASSRAIVSYLTGKRDSGNTHDFIADLRGRVIGSPEISTDGFTPYQNAIRAEFGNRIAHGVVNKTYSVTNLAVKDAARRYSPAQVVAVEYDVVSGIPANISTSYVERSNLTLRMSSKRFARLSNGFSKKLEPHCAAVSLYVAHYNLCRIHESLRSTPAIALGVADRVWTIGDLVDAALATQPIKPTTTAPERRKQWRVIEGGK
ncbi:MAG TPA: transposase [Pseudolabrys sp.]|nr:transposase [Pseudolabrys sp.]